MIPTYKLHGQIFTPRQLLSYMDVMNAENAGAFFCPALLNHKDVVAAIAPGNLAAFPPSLEVNVENAWSSFLSTSCIHAVVGNCSLRCSTPYSSMAYLLR